MTRHTTEDFDRFEPSVLVPLREAEDLEDNDYHLQRLFVRYCVDQYEVFHGANLRKLREPEILAAAGIDNTEKKEMLKEFLSEDYKEKYRKEGREEGVRTLCDLVRMLVEERFAFVPPALDEALENTTNLVKLKKFSAFISLRAHTLADVLDYAENQLR